MSGKVVPTPRDLLPSKASIDAGEVALLNLIEEWWSLYKDTYMHHDDVVPPHAVRDQLNTLRMSVLSNIGTRSINKAVDEGDIAHSQKDADGCQHTTSMQLTTFTGTHYVCSDCGVDLGNKPE